jgi:hypothetical protein
LGSYVIAQNASACTPESLDGKYFSLLHFVPIVILDKGDLFTAMNVIPKNIMACDISDRLHWKGLPGNFNFVAFHYFLDCSADVTHPCINASMLPMYQLDSF